ncbi:MAG TPA: hypothetical protein V6C93_33600 [Allocoleopsis sp.]
MEAHPIQRCDRTLPKLSCIKNAQQLGVGNGNRDNRLPTPQPHKKYAMFYAQQLISDYGRSHL